MLKGVIFDVDGVLVDSHPSHIKAWQKLLLVSGRRLEASDFELLRDGRKKEELVRHFFGGLPDDQIYLYGRQKDLLFQQEMADITTVAGVVELLCELSQAAVSMAVASSGGSARVLQILEKLRLQHYFRAVVTGDEVANGKSDPHIFLRAAQQLRVQPPDLLVFEDSVSGVRAATAAGMKCIGIANTERAQALLSTGAITTMPDFVGLSWERVRQLFSPQIHRARV